MCYLNFFCCCRCGKKDNQLEVDVSQQPTEQSLLIKVNRDTPTGAMSIRAATVPSKPKDYQDRKYDTPSSSVSSTSSVSEASSPFLGRYSTNSKLTLSAAYQSELSFALKRPK